MKSLQISNHFTIEDFACRCGSNKCRTIVNLDFVMMLERLQLLVTNIALKERINSGYRCAAHNKKVGGSENSMHVFGRAVDLHCTDNIERYQLLKAAFEIGFSDISVARTFIHLDNRDIKQSRVY